ncbi:DUF4167 domain-containing protein [Methylocapsa palsarum]|uniref:DUF4167 domain-containing protein n=1 Tax=Methylocapsa palsarum TaxID=1612308 RepID=A0A1I3YR19_9HYPH|nr:DUF4167 domain-containing protein [Methylocapsa palsarum]SFK34210.1 protein of unknown function [Methylocapsa palsarum]
MRPGQNNKRMRGRPNNNRKGPNPLTRSYESSGPDVKIRGTAHHIGEKYLQLARDAQSSGDPVMAESYLQHAEHYFRLIAVAQQAQQQSASGYQRQPGDVSAEEVDGDDFESIPDRFASPAERFAPPQPQAAFAPQSAPSAPQPVQDRPFYSNNPDRQGFERPDRGPRQDRPFHDKPYPDKPYPERNYPERDRPYQDRNGPDRAPQNRDQDNRGQRARGPRDFRNEGQSRNERAESRAPAEEIERNGLPAFITAPVRIEPEPAAAPVAPERLGVAGDDQPDVERADGGGFHLRPRRRRRSKSEMAIDEAAGREEAIANDPVAD